MAEKEKVVLAYSGGLDTSVIVKWLQEEKNLDVIAICGNVGQDEKDLSWIKQKALDMGAIASEAVDMRAEYAEKILSKAIWANGKYEGVYPLLSALSRPLISKHLVDIAHQYGAKYVAHGCTGKGNDQVRFELAVKALAPEMTIIAPWREWDIKSREEEIDYAEAHDIPLKISRETNYSKDKNLWHLSHEGLDLEDPKNQPLYEKPGFLEMCVSPKQAPETSAYVTISFEKGIPVAVNGEKLSPVALVEKLNELGGAHGVGLVDIVENRLVGMKSRGVYETPGGTILYRAHEVLETLCLDRDTLHYKTLVAEQFAELTYFGKWFTPLREAISAFVDKTQEHVTGDVTLELYKGNIINAGVSSPYSQYFEELATFGEDHVYDQKDSAGFINLFGLSIRMNALARQQKIK